jgi:sugar/nucleoside kinase (ribokinase family)
MINKLFAAQEAGTRGIVTIGEILVEVMATEPGPGFREPISLVGPYPSGAPAIFIDQVAKLGYPCGIIGCVGPDDFGWINIDRLRRDGVDVSAIVVAPEEVTGSAFVRYRENGDRDFVFNISNSACAKARLTVEGRSLLHRSHHLHVMGSSFFSPRLVTEALNMLDIVKAKGGTVSFDPNIRKGMLGVRGVRKVLERFLKACDIFLPSANELTLLAAAETEAEAVSEILDLGVTEIVVKNGAEGAVYFSKNGQTSISGFPVVEIDPTGAGDCFGATFVTCRLQGRGVDESLRYAAASGAMAVTRRGPMEGTAGFNALDAFIALQPAVA